MSSLVTNARKNGIILGGGDTLYSQNVFLNIFWIFQPFVDFFIHFQKKS